MKPASVFLASAILLVASAAVSAADLRPAVVFDMGGKFDKSFNQGVNDGVLKFNKETGVKHREFVITNPTQREQAIRKMAQRGSDIILGVGFAQSSAIEKVAKEFPNTKFAIIDGYVVAPNVQSLLFKEHEGSFLVGMLAAMASKSGKIGFIGGMDIPLIRRFACGYEKGAKYVSSKIDVIQNMTGTTPSAWSDPSRGAELTRGQFGQGVDVVFAAAGGTGVGVYQAAKDAGKLAIGTDSNQNYLQPGTMLTSMLKRVDVAAYTTFMEARSGTWKAGIKVFGLKEGGIDWALDENNKALISGDMKAQVDAAKADIIAGRIMVHDYMSDKSCK
ncbi:MAG: BMP family ABC transporter substrate-binding protein [Proteobacteria bacterium]|nr:BMP family ABC transporter substrate-binding protein [Pseudomonadota bacterium]